jgi:hypothetical protein
MGPQSAKSYPGRRVVKPAGPEAQRAKQEIDYGRRGVAGHVFGAFQPAMGDALTAAYVGRTTANWVDFLGKVEAWIDPSRDYQEFRAGLGMIGAKEPDDATSQRTSHS